MGSRNTQHIVEHLQKPDVQERIQQLFQRMRKETTVTISVATALSGFSENQLRDWEERGLLKTLRPGGSKGHRLYPIQELEKLALIRELLNANFSPGDIPTNIDSLWHTISSHKRLLTPTEQKSQEDFPELLDKTAGLSINERLENARKDIFWRYFVSRALHLSLRLISENMPNTTIGLILPLNPGVKPGQDINIEHVSLLGTSLVARLGINYSSHSLLTANPSFEYASDFRLLPFTVMTEDQPEEIPGDNTLIFLNRRSKKLTLSSSMIVTIQRLLKPMYENVQQLYSSFGLGMRDLLLSSPDLHYFPGQEDIILNGLTEVILHLGGQMANGQTRWRFCCVLIPKDSLLPLNQRSLIVRAQSKQSPYKLGITTITPTEAANSLSIRALQNGYIVYLPKISRTDTSIAFRDMEETIRSALAIPIGGIDGLSIAVLYVASDEVAAFSEDDQRVLRMVCRMIEELLLTYFVRQQAAQKLVDLIEKPALVDPLFRDFLSGNDFIRDIEHLLSNIQNEEKEPDNTINYSPTMNSGAANGPSETARSISFISVDIDKHSSIANRYGNQVTRNLAREVGLHIQEQLYTVFRDYSQCQLYHIFADRFYLLLQDIPLERARLIANQLRQGLAGTYKLDALRISIDHPIRPESMLELSDITVRLGVTSYPYHKLKELLQQHSPEDAVVEVRSIIVSTLSRTLDIGRHRGGGVVISWDDRSHSFIELTSPPHISH